MHTACQDAKRPQCCHLRRALCAAKDERDKLHDRKLAAAETLPASVPGLSEQWRNSNSSWSEGRKIPGLAVLMPASLALAPVNGRRERGGHRARTARLAVLKLAPIL